MSKIFEFSPTYGLVDKVSGTALTNSGVTFKRTDKGLAGYFNGASYIDTGRKIIPESSDFTLSLSTKASSYNVAGQNIIGQYYNGNSRFALGYGTTGLLTCFVGYTSGNITLTTPFVPGKLYHIVVTRNGNTLSFYVDGLFISSGIVSTIYQGENTLIGSYGLAYTPRYLTGYAGNVVVENVGSGQTGVNKLYKEFLQLQPLLEKKTNFYYSKPTELNEDGLVFASNMKPSPGNVLTDISGNSNNMTMFGPYPCKDGLQFDGVDDYAEKTSPILTGLTEFTISGIFKTNGTTRQILYCEPSTSSHLPFIEIDINSTLSGGGTNTIRFVGRDNAGNLLLGTSVPYTNGVYNVFTLTRIGNNYTIWINGQKLLDKTETITLGATTGNKSIIGAIWNFFGSNYSSLINGNIDDLKLYNKKLLDVEIKDYHNKWANQIVFQEKFLYDKADGNTVVPTGWIKGTGSYKLVTEPTGNSIIKKCQKYLECTGAGPIAHPSKQAYGTWEFSVRRTGANALFVYLCCEKIASQGSNYGYRFYITSGNALALVFENPSGIPKILTANDYVSANTWYRVKISRTTNGLWTMYIKGGIWIDWHMPVGLVSYPNPNTENTYKTSQFFNVDFDSGDRIFDIVIKQGIEVL